MTRNPLGGRPSKAALTRVKIGTVVVSVIAFLGTLAGVATLNPAVDNATTVAQAPVETATASTDTSSAAQAASQAQTLTFPAVRTRGS